MLGTESPGDEELVARVAAGDRAAATALVERHASAVRRLAQTLVGAHGPADDVTQEALARALASCERYEPSLGKVRTWLFSIARHVAFEQLRHAKRVVPEPTDDSPIFELAVGAGFGAITPEDALAGAEQREALVQALAALPAPDREILVLRDIEGISGEEAAKLLGLDLPATKSRLHRARLRLLANLRAISEGAMPEDRNVAGVSCSEVLHMLGDYVDGELGPTDVARVENHVRGCTVCERFGGRFTATVRDLKTHLGAAPSVSPELANALRKLLG